MIWQVSNAPKGLDIQRLGILFRLIRMRFLSYLLILVVVCLQIGIILGVIVTRHSALRTTIHTFDDLQASSPSLVALLAKKGSSIGPVALGLRSPSSPTSSSASTSQSRLFQRTHPWNVGKPVAVDVMDVPGM
jgi:hypothetical protein